MARTNLLLNPSWETGVGRWNVTAPGGSITYERVAGTPFDGSWTASAYRSSAGHIVYSPTNSAPVTPGLPYTAAVAVLHGGGGGTVELNIEWQDSAGGHLSSASHSAGVPASTWVQITNTATAPAGAVFGRMVVRGLDVNRLARLRLDAALFEQSANFRGYFDGDSPGCAWTGTPHDSTSQDLDPVVSFTTTPSAVLAGEVIALDSSATYDPEGAAVTREWSAWGGHGSFASLTATNTTWTAPAEVASPLEVTLQLWVNDSTGNTGYALRTVVVNPANESPTANAGPDQSVEAGTVVHLDGSGSSDPDPGDTLTYEWAVLDAGSTALTTAELVGASSATPSFTAPRPQGGVDTAVVLRLTVTDSHDVSSADTVTISVAADVLLHAIGSGGALAGGAADVEDGTFIVLADVTMSGGLTVGGHGRASKFEYEVHEPPLPVARPIRYEAVLVARVPAESAPPRLVLVDRLIVDGLSYTHELNRPGQANLGCPIRSLSAAVKDRLADLARFPCEVWIYRDATLVWAGDLQTVQVQGQTATVNCAGLLGYTRRMGVVDDEVFEQEDQFTIAARLVDQWQELAFGHYGIDTSNITTSGVLRDRSYLRDELHNVGERLEDLTEVIDGFDMHVDPETRELVLSHPTRSRDLSGTVFFDDRNIDSADVALSVGPEDLVTDTSATSSFFTEGAGQQLLHTARENPSLRATFGRTWGQNAHHDISEQSTLEGHADAYLDARAGVFFQPGVSAVPRPGADIGEFEPGDWVSYSYDAGIGRQSGVYRVAKVTVTVDTSGAERLGVEFV